MNIAQYLWYVHVMVDENEDVDVEETLKTLDRLALACGRETRWNAAHRMYASLFDD